MLFTQFSHKVFLNFLKFLQYNTLNFEHFSKNEENHDYKYRMNSYFSRIFLIFSLKNVRILNEYLITLERISEKHAQLV